MAARAGDFLPGKALLMALIMAGAASDGRRGGDGRRHGESLCEAVLI